MENIDIKDFQSVSAVAELDNILLVQSTGTNGKMTVSLFKTAIKNDVTPSVKNDVWWIGTVNTGVTAAGKTPEFRKGDLGIEWKYTTDTAWKLLVNYETLSLTFDDLTQAQKDSLKLKYSDLTEEEIAGLQQPARDMIATLQATDTSVTAAEALRVSAENKRQADTAAAIESAIGAAGAANTAAENVQDGKTPSFAIGTVSKGESASATVTPDGSDSSGNPKYKINMVLPKGDKGEQGIKGDTGDRGIQGVQGSVGATGKSLEFTWSGYTLGVRKQGETAYTYSQSLRGATGERGIQGLRGEKGDKGLKGDTGEQGVQGEKGDTGAQGIQGLKGDTGNTGDNGKEPVLEFDNTVTGNPGTQASATLTPNGSTADGHPKYLLSLTIPRGDKGLPGEGSGNVSASGTGLMAGKKYLFVPSSNGSTEGSFVEYAAPTIPEQVQPDWNATSGNGAILNKPAIPTKVSQLTNDSNFADKNYVDEEIGKLPTPDVSAQIGAHNTSGTAHSDIRTLITNYLSTAKGYTDTQIAALIGTAPEILDTLGELADAVMNNRDAVTAINNAIAQKLGKTEAQSLYVAIQGYVAYSQTEKTKLEGIATGANKTTVDSSLSGSSTNPVQNKVINTALAGKANSSHTHTKSQITNFPTSMPASDVSAWAKAANKPGYSYGEISNAPTSLKNPYSLKFIGAATGTYDGSSELTLTIPTIAGEKGEKGDTGDTGAQGIKGDTGDNGDNGITPLLRPASDGDWQVSYDGGYSYDWVKDANNQYCKSRGEKGAKGDKGDTGEQGIQGLKGDKGDKGLKGDTGDRGIQGVQGSVGATGKSLEFTWSGYTLGVRKQGEISYVYSKDLRGATGERGIQGLRGEKGDKGLKGDTGEQGIQGEKGEKGNTGAQGIPGLKGDKGDTGEQGEKGEKGDQGEKGTTTWSGITDKPSWIGISKPTYSWSDILSKPYWIGSSKPTYTYAEVGAASSAHTHSPSEIRTDSSNRFVTEAQKEKLITLEKDFAKSDFSNVVTKSLAKNGYYKLPDGLLIQWGYSGASIGFQYAYFPVSFLDTNYAVVTTTVSQYQKVVGKMLVSKNTSSFRIRSVTAEGDGGEDWNWIAIGRWK